VAEEKLGSSMVHVSNVPAGRTESLAQALAEDTNARERMKDKAAAFIEDLRIGNEEAMLVSELKGPMPARAAIPLFGQAFYKKAISSQHSAFSPRTFWVEERHHCPHGRCAALRRLQRTKYETKQQFPQPGLNRLRKFLMPF